MIKRFLFRVLITVLFPFVAAGSVLLTFLVELRDALWWSGNEACACWEVYCRWMRHGRMVEYDPAEFDQGV